MPTVVIADDHPMCRKATLLALAPLSGDYSFKEVETMRGARGVAQGAALVILDLMLPDMWGLAGLLELCNVDDPPPVLVVTGHDNAEYAELTKASGAAGFVSKNASLDVLASAAKAVLSGKSWFRDDGDGHLVRFAGQAGDRTLAEKLRSLSKAERRVLAAMSDGSLNKQIAHDLDLSEITIKQHIKAILRKTGATNRTQAALMVQFFADQTRLQEAFESGKVPGVSGDW
ncbi:MAG: response regulator transcription factor [Novosphingobium sp.]|nr:response regulator transcription factor [Novosphingobium sp.]